MRNCGYKSTLYLQKHSIINGKMRSKQKKWYIFVQLLGYYPEAQNCKQTIWRLNSTWNGFSNKKITLGGAWMGCWIVLVCYWSISCEWQVVPPSARTSRCQNKKMDVHGLFIIYTPIFWKECYILISWWLLK